MKTEKEKLFYRYSGVPKAKARRRETGGTGLFVKWPRERKRRLTRGFAQSKEAGSKAERRGRALHTVAVPRGASRAALVARKEETAKPSRFAGQDVACYSVAGPPGGGASGVQ